MARTIASSEADTGNREIGGIAWRPILATISSFLAVVWQKIGAGFWGVRNKLSSDIAKPLDIERISRQLAVVKRAEEEGRRNLPPPGEEVPAGTQREIIAYFSNLRRRAQQQVAETAEKTSRALEQIHLSDSVAKLRDLPADCENQILRYVADFDSRLNNAVEREEKQKQHYDAFREKNGLDRVAHYPGAAYYYYLLVLVLIAAFAFALASIVVSDAGGTSGVSVAWIVTLSVAAVIVPFLFGDLLLRRINHVGGFNKFIGWIGTIVAVTTILGMAYYADFHIAAVLASPDASNRNVLDAMLVAPLDVVADVASWKIFGLVILTGLLAMLLGYRSDDLYPGYGAAQRAYYRSRDDRDDGYSRLRKRINVLVDEASAEVTSIIKGFKTKVRTYTRLVEKSKQNPSALNDYDVELEETCNIVLDRYRMANAATRQSDSPMSFSEHVCFNPDSGMDSSWHADNSSHVAQLQTAMVELENEANSARQNLRELNLRMINSMAEPQSAQAESTD
ncbi:MAG: YndM family protein [Gammaproteobacteria bacterium]|nr:YndM family protein [Gammaproteobacteria bacterium]